MLPAHGARVHPIQLIYINLSDKGFQIFIWKSKNLHTLPMLNAISRLSAPAAD